MLTNWFDMAPIGWAYIKKRECKEDNDTDAREEKTAPALTYDRTRGDKSGKVKENGEVGGGFANDNGDSGGIFAEMATVTREEDMRMETVTWENAFNQ